MTLSLNLRPLPLPKREGESVIWLPPPLSVVPPPSRTRPPPPPFHKKRKSVRGSKAPRRSRKRANISSADLRPIIEASKRKRKQVVIKRIRPNDPSSALVSKKCNYCGLLPSNHYCRKKKKGSGVVIEGEEEEEICGKLSCFACREKWGAAEEFLNRCRDCGGAVVVMECWREWWRLRGSRSLFLMLQW